MAERVRKRSHSFSSADFSHDGKFRHPRILLSPGSNGKLPRRMVIDFSTSVSAKRQQSDGFSQVQCKICAITSSCIYRF